MCVDAGPNPKFPKYVSPLILNQVYVVADARLNKFGVMGIALIGIAPHPDFTQQTFSTARFRLLSELKAEAAQVQKRELVAA